MSCADDSGLLVAAIDFNMLRHFFYTDLLSLLPDGNTALSDCKDDRSAVTHLNLRKGAALLVKLKCRSSVAYVHWR